MAKTVKVILTCDLDHESPVDDDVKTIEFGYEGNRYTIDLCGEHTTEYHNWMQDYVAHGQASGRGASRARALTRKAGSTGRAAEKPTGDDLAAVRAWARANNFTVSDRGRIPQTVRDAYEAAK